MRLAATSIGTEYWIGKQLSGQWAVRGGRFFPAYGIRFADHTAYSRTTLGFDKYDQVFGGEVSHTTGEERDTGLCGTGAR